MKKIIIFVSVLALSLSGVQAKDYVKMQIKEMKHAQKYGTTKTVSQSHFKCLFPPLVIDRKL